MTVEDVEAKMCETMRECLGSPTEQHERLEALTEALDPTTAQNLAELHRITQRAIDRGSATYWRSTSRLEGEEVIDDYMLAGPRIYAMIRAEAAAELVSLRSGFRSLDWRKQKRLQNKARRSARAELLAAPAPR